jgi:predicted small secreted protein
MKRWILIVAVVGPGLLAACNSIGVGVGIGVPIGGRGGVGVTIGGSVPLPTRPAEPPASAASAP